MLYADKRALETNLQVSLLKIREKELQFYTQNCIAIGTQAALLSGFPYNGIIQVDIPSESSDWLKTCYLWCAHAVRQRRLPHPKLTPTPSAIRRVRDSVTTFAMGFELIAVLNSTLCSMLCVRGPDAPSVTANSGSCT